MFIHPINASTEVTNVDDAMIQPNTIDLRVNRVFKIGGGPMHMDENTKKHRKSIEVLPDEDGNYLLDQGTCYEIISNQNVEIADGDGSTDTYSLPSEGGATHVFVDGQKKTLGILGLGDYTISGDNVVFNSAPSTGASISIIRM